MALAHIVGANDTTAVQPATALAADRGASRFVAAAEVADTLTLAELVVVSIDIPRARRMVVEMGFMSYLGRDCVGHSKGGGKGKSEEGGELHFDCGFIVVVVEY